MSDTLLDANAADQWFADTDPEAAAVRDAEGVLYLLGENEDGVFYVGIPQAEDEYGTRVDRNTGFLDRPTPGAYGPTFPLEVITTGRMAFGVNPPAHGGR